ncbi:PAP fimbrial minor pilin protein precursor [Serratia proteamaculans]|uniref:fimbrial protein n=1 Tax=Serratia proteamaculans TaxID=28151 RepID=UPI002178827B|nr:fimbrial protein [Serratia proteamaculans]CAI0742356.1 PAP fimbrial minor pilin protein precursor [Serratia proteamaculans]CAI1533491.1 PAP fimbrial minor pilin protein precursor [Serratia proteamaculans]
MARPLFYLMLLAMYAGAPAVQAAPTASAGHGSVSMTGAIIDTACAIDIGSRAQAIVLPTLPVGQLIREGQGPTQPFAIRLVNCTLSRPDPRLPDWQTFQVTFDGPADGKRFRITGAAHGIALQIADGDGRIALPGVSLPLQAVKPGTLELPYTLRLVGNTERLRPGDYRAAVRFKLDYY